jgi:hypothetical protein
MILYPFGMFSFMHRKRKEVAHQNATSSFLFIFEKRFIERKYIARIYMAVGHKFRE